MHPGASEQIAHNQTGYHVTNERQSITHVQRVISSVTQIDFVVGF